MAFDVAVSCNNRWKIEAPWWKPYELMADPRFKDVSKDAAYTDSEANMSAKDAKALADKYGARVGDESSKELNARLDEAEAEGLTVTILVFEWESGLDS